MNPNDVVKGHVEIGRNIGARIVRDAQALERCTSCQLSSAIFSSLPW